MHISSSNLDIHPAGCLWRHSYDRFPYVSFPSLFLPPVDRTIIAIFGYFADRSSSSKSPFVVGLFALAISTACFMLSTSLAGFLIARIMQSLSATAVWVAGLALVTDTVDESRVAEVMGYTSAGMTGGMLLGPALGGIMFEKLGFSAAFYLPIALIAVDIVLRFAMIEPKGIYYYGNLPMHISSLIIS